MSNRRISIPGSVDLNPKFKRWGLPVRAQGGRGTCSVFAVIGALEYAFASQNNKGVLLSVEFLNWAGHKVANRRADGGFFSELWNGFVEYGVCEEADLPYMPEYDPDLQPPAACLESAKQSRAVPMQLHWIKDWDVSTGLNDSQFNEIKIALAREFPVCGGFRWPKKAQWKDEVLQMCPPEDVFDGHSVVLAGYKDDPAQPGGGVFIIRNSGGDSRSGYMSYEYVKAYMNDAVWIEPVG